MATRRTRIRAVANINQKRKNIEDNIIKSQEIEISSKKDKDIQAECDRDNVDQQIGTASNDDTELSGDTSFARENKQHQSGIQNTERINKDTVKFIKPTTSDIISRVEVGKNCSQNDVADDLQVIKTNSTPFLKPSNKSDVPITIAPDYKESTTFLDDYGVNSSKSDNDGEIQSSLNSKTEIPVPTQKQNCPEIVDYQRPPPSPTKINRSRIKAVPRLGYRKTSFSASESEDECKRNNNRNRNDSVCSVASLTTETLAECLSPQRSKQETIPIHKKTARTELTRKVAEARREFQRKFGSCKPDRQKLTMMDLIFYNPDTNPMVEETKRAKIDMEEKVDDPESEVVNSTETEKDKDEEENEMPVPQIKIGPTGEIIIDEKSIVVEREDIKRKRDELAKQKLIDGDFDTGYGIYKKSKKSKSWSQSETLRFYKALNTLGTDFTLMMDLFPSRTRRDLKIKFTKEERTNRTLVDKALMQPCRFDYAKLKEEVEMEEKEQEELKRQKEERDRIKQQKIRAAERGRKPSQVKGGYRLDIRDDDMNTSDDAAVPKISDELRDRLAAEEEQRARESSEPLSKIRKRQSKSGTKNENAAKLVVTKFRKRKRSRKDIEEIVDDIDADESDIASPSDSEDEVVLSRKPTRSGRMPKVVQKYTADDVVQKEKRPRKNLEPGSIMVVMEEGRNEEPLYKVFMITPDNGRQPLNLDSESISRAIKLKQGMTAENILTISTTNTDDEQDDGVPAENNYTIAHTDEDSCKSIPDGSDVITPNAVVEDTTIETIENNSEKELEDHTITNIAKQADSINQITEEAVE